MDGESKSRFLKVYSDLPIKLRQEVICVIEGEPISWNAAFIEINNETTLGEEILKKLILFEII